MITCKQMEEETTFSLSSVPSFLKCSDLYLTFAQNEESDDVTLPSKYCAFDCQIDSPAQLQSALSTLHFWGSPEIPDTMLDFIMRNDRHGSAQILEAFNGLNFTTVAILSCVIAAESSIFHENNILNVACRYKSMPLVRYLEKRGCISSNDRDRGCEAAAKNGSLECLKYFHTTGGDLNRDVLSAAIQSKSLACVQYYLQENGDTAITSAHVDSAAANGDISMMQYLKSLNGKWSHQVCTFAAKGKSLDCVKYAYEDGAQWDARTFEVAAQLGLLDMVIYLHEHQCPSDAYLCDNTASKGQLACLMYLHEHGYKMTSRTCELAARNGHLECLKYAHAQGCAISNYAMQVTAANGHVHILQYCAERELLSCKATLCHAAGAQGHTEVLIFLHRHGCIINADTVEATARRGHVHCLTYLLEHNCPGLENAAMVAAQYGQLELLKLLHTRGCRFDEREPRAAARHGHVDCLQYLHEHGCTWSKGVCISAIYGGHYDCFEYAELHGCPVDWEVEEAAEKEANKEFIQLLRSDFKANSTKELSLSAKKCVIC